MVMSVHVLMIKSIARYVMLLSSLLPWFCGTHKRIVLDHFFLDCYRTMENVSFWCLRIFPHGCTLCARWVSRMSYWGSSNWTPQFKFQVNSDLNVKVVEGGMCSPMGNGMYLLEVSVCRVEDTFLLNLNGWPLLFLLLARAAGMCTI